MTASEETFDILKDDLSAHLLEFPRKIRIGFGRVAGCRPEVITYEGPKTNAPPGERTKPALDVMVHFPGTGRIKGAAPQYLGMTAQVSALRRVHSNLVVAEFLLPMFGLEASSQRQAYPGAPRCQNHPVQRLVQCLTVELGPVSRERSFGCDQEIDALIKRKSLIIETIQQLIKEKGEESVLF